MDQTCPERRSCACPDRPIPHSRGPVWSGESTGGPSPASRLTQNPSRLHSEPIRQRRQGRRRPPFEARGEPKTLFQPAKTRNPWIHCFGETGPASGSAAGGPADLKSRDAGPERAGGRWANVFSGPKTRLESEPMRVNPALTGRATTGLRRVARSVTSGRAWLLQERREPSPHNA